MPPLVVHLVCGKLCVNILPLKFLFKSTYNNTLLYRIMKKDKGSAVYNYSPISSCFHLQTVSLPSLHASFLKLHPSALRHSHPLFVILYPSHHPSPNVPFKNTLQSINASIVISSMSSIFNIRATHSLCEITPLVINASSNLVPTYWIR